MCGIIGVICFRDPPDDGFERTFLKARDLMTHRGPDDAGFYRSPDGRCLLGHRRLSIVDLTPQGHQPMANEDDTLWVVFNGEIYNQVEIRKELVERGHCFRSRSDTEVLLHLYEDLGEEMVHRINGEFAFAIYDQRKQALFAVRDRVGVKPLFYSADGRRFAFASEPKALLALSDVSGAVREEEIETYLTFNCLPGPETLYRDVNKLEPGRTISVHPAGSVNIRRYWSPACVYDPHPENAGDRLRGLTDSLARATEHRMMSDVPIAAALSGGIDSTIVATYMSEVSEQPIHTFTIGYPGDEKDPESDLNYARRIAKRLRSRHEEIIITDCQVEDTLGILPLVCDDPIGAPSVTANLHLAQFVRSGGAVVVQVGEGGDEVCCGYESVWRLWRLHERLPRWIGILPRRVVGSLYPVAKPVLRMLRNPSLIDSYDGTLLEQIRRYANGEHLHWGFGTLLPPSELDDLRGSRPPRPVYGHIARRIKEIDSFEKRDYFDQLALIDIALGLPERLLMRVDRTTMAYSVEARVPFLAPEVIAAGFSIPISVRGTAPKAAIKLAAVHELPEEILNRKKAGFPTSRRVFLAPSVFPRIREAVLDNAFLDVIPLRQRHLRAYVERILADPARNFYRIWSLFVLSLWYRHWGQ